MAIVIEFDRGTLLIRGLQNGGTTARLPVLWDPRVHAHRARAMHYSALRRLLEISSCAFTDRVRLPGIPEQRPAAWRSVGLRPYQEAAALQNVIQCDHARFLLQRGWFRSKHYV